MTDFLVQVAMGFFGVILLIITGLMAFMTKAVIEATRKISILEVSLGNTETVLKSIALDLKTIAKHDTSIALLQQAMDSVKAEVALLFEKLRINIHHE